MYECERGKNPKEEIMEMLFVPLIVAALFGLGLWMSGGEKR